MPRACVLGGGTMGAGIAASFALAGEPVTVVVRRAVDEVVARVERRLAAHGGDDARRLVDVRLGVGGGPYDVVIETIVEDARAKRELLAEAEREVAPDGVLCTNTSSLAIRELAPALARPERFAGWHWFNPADLVRLVEIVPGADTDPATIERLAEWSRSLGKTPVVLARDIEGFVANRLQYALLREAYALVEGGVCSLADVDAAVTAGLGPRWAAIGPFTTMDLAGLDVHAAVARELFPRLSRDTAVPELLEHVVATGARGVKSGAGLLGTYSAEDAAALEERRDRVLAAFR